MKLTNDEGAKLRREIATRATARSRLNSGLRKRCEVYAASRAAAGAGKKEIASELGVSEMTVHRWLRAKTSTAMVPVRIIAPSVPKQGGVIVTTRNGLRVEGLELDALCMLIARVG